jgi:hypothetical protein
MTVHASTPHAIPHVDADSVYHTYFADGAENSLSVGSHTVVKKKWRWAISGFVPTDVARFVQTPVD